jgi:hypothetical protein
MDDQEGRIDWLVENYGDIIQVATPNAGINPYVGGYFIVIVAPIDELKEIQRKMNWGSVLRSRPGSWRWELSTSRDGEIEVKKFAHELMHRFEERDRYGNFYVKTIGKRFWYDCFGSPK